jgi:hypothetical protein
MPRYGAVRNRSGPFPDGDGLCDLTPLPTPAHLREAVENLSQLVEINRFANEVPAVTQQIQWVVGPWGLEPQTTTASK